VRRIIRTELTKDIQKYLARKQEEIAATDAVESLWKKARKTKSLQAVFNQRSDTGPKAPLALGGSAMVARPTRRQIIAVNCTAPACHDRGAGPGHSTSEMIQEDMKILEPRSDPSGARRSRRGEYAEEKHDRGE